MISYRNQRSFTEGTTSFQTPQPSSKVVESVQTAVISNVLPDSYMPYSDLDQLDSSIKIQKIRRKYKNIKRQHKVQVDDVDELEASAHKRLV